MVIACITGYIYEYERQPKLLISGILNDYINEYDIETFTRKGDLLFTGGQYTWVLHYKSSDNLIKIPENFLMADNEKVKFIKDNLINTFNITNELLNGFDGYVAEIKVPETVCSNFYCDVYLLTKKVDSRVYISLVHY